MIWFAFLLGLGIASMAYVFWSVRRRKHRIPALLKTRLRERWEDVKELTDPSRRVMEAEKVCDAVLKALDYHGTFAEKLHAAAPQLSHMEDLWSAHRLRNRIAHEIDCRVSDAQGNRALQAFATIVHRFLA